MSRILVTSALPYVNGIKHLGNLVGSMLPADIYARYQRARIGAANVLFVCATDEHGTPAEIAALEEGLPIAEYTAKYHGIQKGIYDAFGLSFDHFGRTSAPQNHELTQAFARDLWTAGHLDVRTTRQVYSNADKRFLPDRYVIGTCPHCGYERARGDQCENCTRVLDPVDLIAPRSALSGSPDIEIRDTAHLFLKQSAFAERIREWVESKQASWSNVVSSIALKWLDEGLRDRGITRDLSWGVPVPDDIADGRLTGKVFYVWFDAPIGYIGASREWADAKGEPDAWQSWWRGPEAADVRYVEFMGKDNVPFHTVGFPVTIMGSNEATNRPWKLVDDIKGFNWLNYYGGKFSTSGKRGIFTDQALALLPADYWRWYLIANAPESSDANFTWEHFAATVNKDLADVLGNFVNRVLKFGAARFGAAVPDGGAYGPFEAKLAARLEELVPQYAAQLEAMQFRKAAQELRAIWVAANEFVAEAAPWTAIKTSPETAAASIRAGINLIRLIAILSAPIIPHTAATLASALNLGPGDLAWPHGSMTGELAKVSAGKPFGVPDVLFAKISDEQIASGTTQFAGAA